MTTFSEQIQALIDSMEADKVILDALIAQRGSETPVSGDGGASEIILNPDDTWTLKPPATPDGNGVYGGVYTLALTTGQAVLDLISYQNIVAPSDGIVAQYRAAAGGVLIDVTNINELDGLTISELIIRSTTAFEAIFKFLVPTSGAWSIEALGTSGISKKVWLQKPYNLVTHGGGYYANDPTYEVQSVTSNNFVQWALRLAIPAGNTLETIKYKVRSSNTGGNVGVICHILDNAGNVVWDNENCASVVPSGSGATTEFCIHPYADLPDGGSMVLFFHANDSDYSYANLVNVQVVGDGITPYTPNAVTTYVCACVTYDFLTGDHDWAAVVATGDGYVRATYEPSDGWTTGTHTSSLYSVKRAVRIYGGNGNPYTLLKMTVRNDDVSADECIAKVWSTNNNEDDASRIELGEEIVTVPTGINVIEIPLCGTYLEKIRADIVHPNIHYTGWHQKVYITKIELC